MMEPEPATAAGLAQKPTACDKGSAGRGAQGQDRHELLVTQRALLNSGV